MTRLSAGSVEDPPGLTFVERTQARRPCTRTPAEDAARNLPDKEMHRLLRSLPIPGGVSARQVRCKAPRAPEPP